MKAEKRAGINFFQRYLTVWVFLCMVVGVVLGHFAPALPTLLAKLEYARVSIPMAILIWIMIYPMMLKVDFKSVRDVGKKPKLHLNRRPARSAARIAKPGHRIDCPSATIPPHTKKPPGKHLVVFQETFVLFSRMWFC